MPVLLLRSKELFDSLISSIFLLKSISKKSHIWRIFVIGDKTKFSYLDNGPTIPQKIAIVSGGASSWYEKSIDEGIDTYITGEIDERIPNKADRHINNDGSLCFTTKANESIQRGTN